MKGKVKFFDRHRGFGFIEPEGDGQDDVFIHYSAIEGTGYRNLESGDSVEFNVRQGEKGPQALNVVKVAE